MLSFHNCLFLRLIISLKIAKLYQAQKPLQNTYKENHFKNKCTKNTIFFILWIYEKANVQNYLKAIIKNKLKKQFFFTV